MAWVSQTAIEIAKLVISAATPIVALSAFIIALRTYRSNAEWKRVELANNYLKELRENKELELACRALDWHSGRLVVPESLQPLLRAKGSKKNRDAMEHDLRVTGRAMDVKVTPKAMEEEPPLDAMEHDRLVMRRAMDVKVTPIDMEQEPRIRVYRTAIDSLLSWLSLVQKALDRKLFYPQDLQPVAWWLFRMSQAPYLDAFMCQYGYREYIDKLNKIYAEDIGKFRKQMPPPTIPTGPSIAE